MDREYNIDLLKIIACIAVIGLHTFNSVSSAINLTLYYLCGFAVPIFFMCSGYFLISKERITFKYLLNKILSIAKIVVLWNLIIFLGKCLNGEIALKDIFSVELLIIESLIQKGFMWHFWYFGALILIYICLPIIIFLKEKGLLKKVWFGLIAICIALQFSSYLVGRPIQSQVVQSFRIWSHLQYFILGGLLNEKNKYTIFPEIEKLKIKAHTIIFFVYTCFTVAYQNCLSKYFLNNPLAEYFYDSAVTVLWVVLLFTLIRKLKLSVELNKGIKFFETLTFGIYIIHPLFLKVFKHFILINGIGISLIYFIFVTVLSIISTWTISKFPIKKFLIEL